jgi:hypothetical protein
MAQSAKRHLPVDEAHRLRLSTHWEEQDYYRRHFAACLGKAEELLEIVSNQGDTNPTYSDLLDIMALRSGLDDESLDIAKEINYFLTYDNMFEPAFYSEMSTLAEATEEAVTDALSLSGDPSDLSQDETIGTPKAEGGANSPAAAAVGTRGDGVRETPT